METETKLAEAAEFFGIGIITSSRATESGIGNENYIVETTKGSFILRRLWEQTIEGLRNERAIQLQLASVNIATAHLIKGQNESYYFQLEDQVITASKKIEGEHPKHIDNQLAKRIGSLLAKFHQVVTYLPIEEPNWLNKDIALTNAKKIENSSLKPRIDQYLKENGDLFEFDLPVGIIHGDLHAGNLLITPDDQLVLFDFETAERNIFVIDIALALMNIDNNMAFLEGYQEVRKLTKVEHQNLKKAKHFASAAVAAWLVERGQDQIATKMLDLAGT